MCMCVCQLYLNYVHMYVYIYVISIKLLSKELLTKYGGRAELVDGLIRDKVGYFHNIFAYEELWAHTWGGSPYIYVYIYGRLLRIYPNHIQSLAHGLILGCRSSIYILEGHHHIKPQLFRFPFPRTSLSLVDVIYIYIYAMQQVNNEY